MNAERFTQKTLDAIRAAQTTAAQHSNQQVEQVHLLDALLEQKDGLVPQILKSVNVPVEEVNRLTDAAIDALPAVTGIGREDGKIYISRDVDRALADAEATAERMKDDYVSVEHLFLALIDDADATLKGIYAKTGVKKDAVLKALQSVRGNTRVTSDNPENTYNALKRYGTDLVERARSQKLDPVIGRDEEIRSVTMILSRKTKNNFLKEMQAVRGNTRVTSDQPEETYDVLNKYGQELVELARRQKLDPVIGRDNEIRNVIRILLRKT
ncbi:MAG: hypothetical protein IJL26_11600, partial [Clostridia bacterium]|nr:hypothetical protein [Clostridia bacterium]